MREIDAVLALSVPLYETPIPPVEIIRKLRAAVLARLLIMARGVQQVPP
jgi:hypothetical protein